MPFLSVSNPVEISIGSASEKGKVKYVPAWTPGARIQKLSKEYRAILGAVADIPYTFVKSRVASGTYDQSYVSKHLVGTSLDHGTEEIIKWTAGVLYLGGADTVRSQLTALPTHLLIVYVNEPELS